MEELEKKEVFSNLNRENKWLGIIDYKSLVILLMYIVIIWLVSGIFSTSMYMRIYSLVITTIPVIGVFYSNKSSESIASMIYIVIKYIISPKLYVYRITDREVWFK